MNIILLGLPGSGKSTQGKLLSKRFGIPWISIGELLREEYRKGTADGIEANKYLAQGLNCPTEIKKRILEKILIASKKGFILDNYPRTENDLIHLKDFLKRTGIKISKAILLKTSEQEVIKRLVKKGQIDSGGGKRNDISLDNIKIRIEKGFKEDAELIINYFSQMGILVIINGGQTIEKVDEDIVRCLK